ncbi:MAG: hypothetical protein ACTSPY_04910 [Candidatus Helarchaeota archaeon]
MMDLLQTQKKKKLNEISNVDKLIIREYIKNPQNSILNISKNIDRTRQTISKSFKKLLRNEVINFSINVNSECLNLDYYLIRVELKRNSDVEYFLNLFYKCPKTFYVFHSLINNQIIALIFEEYNDSYLKSNTPCKRLLDQIQVDPRVNLCTIEGLIIKMIPQFLPLDTRRISKKGTGTPCGANCNKCSKYRKYCLGCPGTSYYEGNFSF